MRRPDVRGFHDHIRDRQQRAVVVVLELADLELAPIHRGLGVNHRLGRHQPQLHRLRHREDLEGRAQLVNPLHRAVEQRAVGGITRSQRQRAVVGVEIRQRHQRQHFAIVDIHQHRSGGLGIHHLHAGRQHLFGGGLHRQIKRQRQRGADLPRIAQPRIKRLFHPCGADHFGRMHPFGAETGPPQHMRRKVAVGIKPHLARAEQQTGVADVMHRLHLLGRHHPAQPQKAAPVGEATLKIAGVKIGKDRGQRGGGAGRIDHVLGLGIKRIGQQVGGHQATVAVGDVGALRQNRRPRGRRLRLDRVSARQHRHPHPDRPERQNERQPQHQQPSLGAGTGAVAQRIVAQHPVFMFDAIGIVARRTRRQDARQRAQRNADHGVLSCCWPITSTGWLISGRAAAG